MTPAESLKLIKEKLPELYAIDFGFPLGDNLVKDPVEAAQFPNHFVSKPGSNWLISLYSACDGLSLPDVHVGYFLKPLERVASFDPSSEPNTIVGSEEESVLPFGSTGNGSLIVVNCQKGHVLLLPPGAMHNGKYDNSVNKVKEVAATVSQFIERLYTDVVAFVDDDTQHQYIA